MDMVSCFCAPNAILTSPLPCRIYKLYPIPLYSAKIQHFGYKLIIIIVHVHLHDVRIPRILYILFHCERIKVRISLNTYEKFFLDLLGVLFMLPGILVLTRYICLPNWWILEETRNDEGLYVMTFGLSLLVLMSRNQWDTSCCQIGEELALVYVWLKTCWYMSWGLTFSVLAYFAPHYCKHQEYFMFSNHAGVSALMCLCIGPSVCLCVRPCLVCMLISVSVQ